MTNTKWKVLIELEDSLQTPIIQSLLEAHGIGVIVSQEPFQAAIGLSLMGSQILVPEDQLEDAKKIIDQNFKGDLKNNETEDQG